MATLSSILAWRTPMDRGAWWATVHGVAELDTTEQLSTAHTAILYLIVSKQSQSNIEAKQDPLGPSQVQKSIHAPHFLFVEKGFTLLGPP